MTRTICLKTGAERYTNKWFDRRTLNRVKRTKPDVDELTCRQKRTDYKSVTTSQPPRSALRCVPLTDSCFTFPSVLLQPETHSLSAFSMQDPSALPGGGPTSPPSFRTTTSTSCCWRRPGCALPVTTPRSPTWLRLGTRSSPSPAPGGGAKGGASTSLLSRVSLPLRLSCLALLPWGRSSDFNLQHAANRLLYLSPST